MSFLALMAKALKKGVKGVKKLNEIKNKIKEYTPQGMIEKALKAKLSKKADSLLQTEQQDIGGEKQTQLPGVGENQSSQGIPFLKGLLGTGGNEGPVEIQTSSPLGERTNKTIEANTGDDGVILQGLLGTSFQSPGSQVGQAQAGLNLSTTPQAMIGAQQPIQQQPGMIGAQPRGVIPQPGGQTQPGGQAQQRPQVPPGILAGLKESVLNMRPTSGQIPQGRTGRQAAYATGATIGDFLRSRALGLNTADPESPTTPIFDSATGKKKFDVPRGARLQASQEGAVSEQDKFNQKLYSMAQKQATTQSGGSAMMGIDPQAASEFKDLVNSLYAENQARFGGTPSKGAIPSKGAAPSKGLKLTKPPKVASKDWNSATDEQKMDLLAQMGRL